MHHASSMPDTATDEERHSKNVSRHKHQTQNARNSVQYSRDAEIVLHANDDKVSANADPSSPACFTNNEFLHNNDRHANIPHLTATEIEEACMRPWLSLAALDERSQQLYIAENFLANISFDGSHVDTIYSTFFNFDPDNVVYRANRFAAPPRPTVVPSKTTDTETSVQQQSVADGRDERQSQQKLVSDEVFVSPTKSERKISRTNSSIKRRRENFSSSKTLTFCSPFDKSEQQQLATDNHSGTIVQEVRFTSSVECRDNEKYMRESSTLLPDGENELLTTGHPNFTGKYSADSLGSVFETPGNVRSRGRAHSIKNTNSNFLLGITKLHAGGGGDGPSASAPYRAVNLDIHSFENYIDPKFLERVIEREKNATRTKQQTHYTVDGMTVIRTSCIAQRQDSASKDRPSSASPPPFSANTRQHIANDEYADGSAIETSEMGFPDSQSHEVVPEHTKKQRYISGGSTDDSFSQYMTLSRQQSNIDVITTIKRHAQLGKADSTPLCSSNGGSDSLMRNNSIDRQKRDRRMPNRLSYRRQRSRRSTGGSRSRSPASSADSTDSDGISEMGALQRLIGLRFSASAPTTKIGNRFLNADVGVDDDHLLMHSGGAPDVAVAGYDTDLSYMTLLRPLQWTFHKPPELTWEEVRNLITLGSISGNRIAPVPLSIGGGEEEAVFDEGLSTTTSESMASASQVNLVGMVSANALTVGSSGDAVVSPGVLSSSYRNEPGASGGVDNMLSFSQPPPPPPPMALSLRRSIKRRERQRTATSETSNRLSETQTDDAAGAFALEPEHVDAYDARLVDDRGIFLAAVRVNTQLESIKSSVISSHLFLGEAALKQRVNGEFADRFPHVRITYSKMLSLKRQIRKVCCQFPDTLDVPTAALAHMLFEKLTLRGYTRKDTRKVLASVSVLLAAKLHDLNRSEMRKLQERVEHEFRLSRRLILSYEFATLVALDFDVHVTPEQLEITLKRIGNEDLLTRSKSGGVALGAPVVSSSDHRGGRVLHAGERRRRNHGLKLKESLKNLLIRRTLHERPR